MIFPPDFSQSIQAALQGQPSNGAPVTFVGDLNNPYYSVAGIAANAAIDGYIQLATQQSRPIAYAEEPLGGSGTRSEFETYVPGLLIASATLMMFSIAIAVTHQLEAGVHKRLQITCMPRLRLHGRDQPAVHLDRGGLGTVFVLDGAAPGLPQPGALCGWRSSSASSPASR